MSDRTRGSVRTGSRQGAGVTEAPPGLPADDGGPAAGATAAGAGPVPGASPTASPTGPASGPAGADAPAGPLRPDAPADGGPAGRAAGVAAGPAARVAGASPRPAAADGGSTGGPAGSPTGTVAVENRGAAAPAGPGAPRPADGRGTGGKVRTAAGRGPRRARLQLRHIDTWSALKISLVVSIALFFVWMVAVGVLFGVLNGLGVFATLNDLFGQLGSVSGGDTGGDTQSEVITAGVVFGGAAVIGLINIVLLTALCTVGAVVYNLCSDLVGGVEVTLSERD